jgi:hypothetical protein
MHDKDEPHQPLGEDGALPGAPNGPPANSIANIPLHPFALLFPPMNDKEFEAFKRSIQIEGQHDPIWMYQGQLIDGRHRLRACIELGIPPRFQEWDGKGTLLEFVLAQNLHRRHLKEAQRAMVAARLKPQFEEDAKKRQGARSDLEQSKECITSSINFRENFPESCRSREQAGALLNVSGKSVDFACKILDKGIPALIEAVDLCKLAVSTAADLAEFPKEEQTRLLAAGRAEINKALKPIREARKRKPDQPATQGQDAPATSSFVPFDRPLEKKIFNHFNNGWVLMKRTEQGYRMEINEKYFSDELYRAIESPYFEQLTERGLLLVKVH